MGMKRNRQVRILLASAVLVLAFVSRAFAWTTPVMISPPDDDTCSVPHLCRGVSGTIHSVYRCKTGAWHINYSKRTAAGYWGPIETISQTGVWSERPDIVEDSSGNPNVFFTATAAGGMNDLMWARKVGGSWTLTSLTSTSDTNEDYPRVSIDSTGRLHLIYFKGTGDSGDVIYRTYSGGSWSGETVIGSIRTKVYYDKPDISVDSSDNVHVVWAYDSGTLVYRKCAGGVWGTQQTIGTTSYYLSYPKIAAATASNIAVMTFDQVDSGYKIKTTTSTDGGATWSSFVVLDDGHYPSMDSYNGTAYAVYSKYPMSNGIILRTWNGGSWSAATTISPTGTWQGWSDVCYGTDGVLHAEYDNSGYIGYVSNSNTDATGPDAPTAFAGYPSDGTVLLSWTNPSNVDFQGTMIRYKAGSFPTSPSDGTLVCDRATNPGKTDQVSLSGLTNGTTYYFSAFAHDFTPNYGSAAQITASPVSAPLPNKLSNGDISGFSGGTALGWNTYKVNDNGAISFAIDSSNCKSAPAQGIFGIDSTGLPASGLTAAGIYQVVSGTTVGKVYQYIGYQDIYNSGYTGAGHRYLHNFGINTSGGASPGTPAVDGTIGGCKWMLPSQAFWNDNSGAASKFSGYHRAAAAFQASGTSISVWSGVTVDNAAAKDATTTDFDVDQNYLFEYDFPVNSGLQNGSFEGTFTDLQDGGDTIPAGWVPSGGGIGYDQYMNWQTTANAIHTGSYGFRIWNRRGIVNGGLMQKIACSPSYNQTFTAYVRTSGSESTTAAIGIDPFGGGDITSSNIVWQTTTSSTWTQLSVGAVSQAAAMTVFVKSMNTNATGGSGYHWSDFDDCAYIQGSAVGVGMISGTVTSSAGGPVSGAVVSTTAGGYSTTTNANGYYELTGVAAGTYSVTASRSGFDSQTQTAIAVTANQTASCGFTLARIFTGACGDLKKLVDGARVDVTGKVVTAVFSDEGSIYIEDADRASGVRVAWSGTGLSLGDTVSVVGGTIQTIRPDGATASERQIIGATVSGTAGQELAPLALTVARVGGGADELCAGVNGGAGINNTGLLVRVAGKVTATDNNCLFIDDGSNSENLSASGAARTGVMVRWAWAPIVSVGDMVSAVGVIEGSVPGGWSTNRRLLRCRTARDIVSFYPVPTMGSILGSVKDSSNNPLAGAAISTTGGIYTTSSALDGSYSLARVLAGMYSVTASKTGYYSQTSSGVVVPAGYPVSADFVLSPQPGTISGFVRDASSNAISGAMVSTNTGGYSTTSAADGSYTLSNVTAGSYTVTAAKTGYTSQSNGVTVGLGATVNCSFSLALNAPVEKVTNGTMEISFSSTGWATTCGNHTSAMPSPNTSWGWNNDTSYPFNTWDATAQKHAGTHSLGFSFCQTAGSPGKLGIVGQNVYLGPGATATFSVWAYHTDGNCPPIMAWNPGASQRDPYTANTNGRLLWVCGSNANDNWNKRNMWNNRTTTVTADSSGYVTIMVGGAAWAGTASAAALYIDDVSVQ